MKFANRLFFLSACCVLLMTGIGKLVSTLGDEAILKVNEPLFRVPMSMLLIVVGVVEVSIAAYVSLSRSERARLIVVAWISSCFLIYRAALAYYGMSNPCPCLGSISAT